MAEKWVSKWAAQVFLSLFGTVDYFWNVFRKFWYAPIEKYSNMPKFRQEIKQIFALTALKTHFSLLYFQSPTSKFRIPDPSLMMIMQLEISWFGWKFNYNLPASKDFLFRYVFKIQWDESTQVSRAVNHYRELIGSRLDWCCEHRDCRWTTELWSRGVRPLYLGRSGVTDVVGPTTKRRQLGSRVRCCCCSLLLLLRRSFTGKRRIS